MVITDSKLQHLLTNLGCQGCHTERDHAGVQQFELPWTA